MNNDLVKYYKDRAAEYEKIYSKPERQEELKKSGNLLKELFKGKSVFEIACGTGYWTERIAETAVAVKATDINEAVIDIACKKDYPNKNVSFGLADVYTYAPETHYESLFGGFIWSHIKKQDTQAFLKSVTKLVTPGGTVALMDNNYVEGSSSPITETDSFGNTYQTRKLEDGTAHRILKNFPDENYLRQELQSFSTETRFIKMTYFWVVEYKTPVN